MIKRASFLLIISIFFACTKQNVSPVTGQNPAGLVSAPAITPGDSVSYLALGDSYTYGVGLPQDQSYPYQLAAKLKDYHYLASQPQVVAFQGWKAGDLLKGITSANINSKFDIVTILIGVNDETKGTNIDTYTAQFDQLLSEAIGFAKGYSSRVFVISIPDWSVTPFAAGMDQSKIRGDVKLFNAINQAESARLKVNYIDITALSETVAGDPTLTGFDGLHPTAKMYGLWVGQFYAGITASFK